MNLFWLRQKLVEPESFLGAPELKIHAWFFSLLKGSKKKSCMNLCWLRRKFVEPIYIYICMYVCTYVRMCMYTYINICIYSYIDR